MSNDLFDDLEHDLGGDEVPQSFRHMFDNAKDAHNFMLMGDATITLVSRKTKARFTYRLRPPKDGKGDMFFVNVLTGSDNTSDYRYLGYIRRGVYFWGFKSKIGSDAPSAVAFRWTWSQLMRGHLPDALEVWHEGRCGRCGRKLTVPASIARGLGPECAGRVR